MRTLWALLILALSSPMAANAQQALYNPLGTTSVPGLIGRIVQAVLGITGAAALLMFVYGGFLMLTSGGKSDTIEKGKNTLLWATIGIAVIFGAYALSNFVITQLAGVATTGA